MEDAYAPFPELHMLPISRMTNGEEEVLVDYSRAIYRQLLPGSLTERLVPEWRRPVFYLEEAQMSGREWGWPAHMWIAPRTLRNSSEMSSGLVDWDVYFFAQEKLIRTLRIRVESKPSQTDDSKEIMAVAGATVLSSTTINPLAAVATVIGAGTMATAKPPEAGRSLDLMTELATRQVLFLAQFPINELNPPELPVPPRTVTLSERISGWTDQILAPK